jgi:uncharacterized protein YgiM (DUF1202 family)
MGLQQPTMTLKPVITIIPTLSPIYSTSTPEPAQVVSCTVKTEYEPGNLNLRTCGGTDCSIITVIPEMSLVDVLESCQDGWYLVRYQNQIGYVNSDYLECEVK